jgi:hypothetical protein
VEIMTSKSHGKEQKVQGSREDHTRKMGPNQARMGVGWSAWAGRPTPFWGRSPPLVCVTSLDKTLYAPLLPFARAADKNPEVDRIKAFNIQISNKEIEPHRGEESDAQKP